MRAVRASALVGIPCAFGLDTPNSPDPSGLGPQPERNISVALAAIWMERSARRLGMIAVQFSSLLSEWRSRVEVWLGSWGLLYWSGCFERTASEFIHLARHRRNPRRFM